MAALGVCVLAGDPLPAQETHTFSNVIELGDGRVAAAEATLIDDRTVSFALLAPGLDLEWIEIRDRYPGGTLLATTRSTGNERAPHLQLIGMGEVLNERASEVTIGLEDFLVELTLHAPGGGLERAADEGMVVVGFSNGRSTSFPIDSGEDGAIAMVPGDHAEEVFGAAAARDDTPAPPVRVPPALPAPGPAAPPIRPPQPGPTPAAVPGPAPAPAASGPASAIPGPAPVGPAPAGAGPAAGSVAGSDWLASAAALRGRNGERFEFRCPPGGAAGRGPFGTDVYADHSSVCTAAVHAGFITFASGGTVTIEIRAGQSFYSGSAGQGGVSSASAGSWPGSFAFVR
jgi:hypothetical protein